MKRECPPRPPKEKHGGISISPRTPLKRHKSRGPGPRLWNPTTGGWPGARRHGRLIRPGALLPAAPGVFLAELRPRIWELGIHRGAKRTHFASLSAGDGRVLSTAYKRPQTMKNGHESLCCFFAHICSRSSLLLSTDRVPRQTDAAAFASDGVSFRLKATCFFGNTTAATPRSARSGR